MKKLALLVSLAPLAAFAQEAATTVATAPVGIGAMGFGFAVFASAISIGIIGFSAAAAVGRNPSAAAEIKSAIQLPMFLAEGIGIVAVALLFAKF